MLGAVKLQLSNPAITPNSFLHTHSFRWPYDLRLPIRRSSSLTVHSRSHSLLHLDSTPSDASEPLVSSEYTATVGSPPLSYSHSMLPLSKWNLTQRHILLLNVVACSVAVSATLLFFSAIPTLLAFERAAESLEKLMDATREELPDTMAAIRLSGMEISDLTMELSDLGQEITQGVRKSTRAVRLAEERLRGFTNVPPAASLQRVPSPKTEAGGPAMARTARGIREGIVKGRSILQMFFTLAQLSRMAFNYFSKRAKR